MKIKGATVVIQEKVKMKTDRTRVFNMDCMEYMRTVEDGYFELAVVDPPYFIASQQKRGVGSRIDKTGKMNDWNGILPDERYFNELFRISRNQIIWGANNFEGLPRTEYFCIWDKKQTVDNFATAEYAWVSMGLKKPAKIFTYGIHRHNSDIDRIHPTQKPVKLYEWILMNYAKEGDKILDTHLGSGSSRIAAYNLGFDFTGIELDKEYFQASVDRFTKHKSQLTLF